MNPISLVLPPKRLLRKLNLIVIAIFEFLIVTENEMESSFGMIRVALDTP